MPSDAAGYAFLVLLRDLDDATGLSRLLEDVRLPSASTRSLFLVPPVSGMDFFADQGRQPEIDEWWAENVPRDYVPVYLIDHEDGLADWIKGLDGQTFVGIKNPQIGALYQEDGASVTAFLASGPLDYATVVMRHFCGGSDSSSEATLFDEGEALRMAALSADFPTNLDDASPYGYPDPSLPPPLYPGAGPLSGQPAPAPPFGTAPHEQPFGAPPPFAPPPAFPSPAPAGGGGWNDPWAQPPPFGADPFAAPLGGPFDYPGVGAGAGAGPPKKRPPPDPATPHPFDLLSGEGSSAPAAPPARSATSGPPPASGGRGQAPSPFQGPPPFQAPTPFDPVPRGPSQPGSSPPQSRENFEGLPDLLAPPPVSQQSRNADPWGGQQAPGWGDTTSGAPSPWPAGPDRARGGGASETAVPEHGRGGQGGPRARGPGGRPGRSDNSGSDGSGGASSGRRPGRGRGISLPFSNPFGGKGLGRRDFIQTPDREFARRMIERGPTIVVMGSRKGGVGKTSYAAGVAIVGGQVLDTAGHKAAIVDANIANPDAWGQMNLREGAATVREIVAALTGNRQPPEPVHAQTPALACYPESRETTEYSKTDIRRLADFLRRRYTFIVVDMSNRLPDPMAGPEAAAAAYWLEQADVLVLPTTSSKTDFNGVLDYLDVRNLPPCVVPYIVPRVKKNREHEVTQAYLDEIRTRVHRIIDIPDEADKVRYAGMEGVPVEQVSSSLGLAYRELTEAVVSMPPRERSAGA